MGPGASMLHYLISHVTGAETCSTPIIPTNPNNISRHTLRMFRDYGGQHDPGNALHVVSLAPAPDIRTGNSLHFSGMCPSGPGTSGPRKLSPGGSGMTSVTISLNYSGVPPHMWHTFRMRLFRCLIVLHMIIFKLLLVILLSADTSDTRTTQYGEHTPPRITFSRMFPLDRREE